MRTINLTQNKFAQIDDIDYETTSQYTWTYTKKKTNNTGYAYSYINGIQIPMHRFIMGLKRGDSQKIDYIDGNGLNNTRNNLRFATTSQNSMNKLACINGSSKYKGVSILRSDGYKYWQAGIKYEDKRINLGHFPYTEEGEKSAALAYNEAAMKYFGEFAKLNVVENQFEIVRRTYSSKYRGVSISREKRSKGMAIFYKAEIRVEKRLINLGRFEYNEEGEINAALAYNEAAKKYFNGREKLNIISY